MELRICMLKNLACVKIKGSENEEFRIDSTVRQGCIMYPWLFNVNMDSMMKGVKMGMGRRGESGDYLASCMHIT